MKNLNNTFNLDNFNNVKLNLLNGQLELILRALELYGYNLEYMLNESELEHDTKQEKLAMLKYTYEQLISAQAEQVNGKSNNIDNLPVLGKNMHKENNIYNIIPENKESHVG